MGESNTSFSLEVDESEGRCPSGKKIGNRNMTEGKIPVISCEGGCIRGEIARLAANIVAKEEPYSRGCHGEMLTVPHSAISQWSRKASKVILIDGCFLRCHGRIFRNLIGEDRLIEFDALSFYKKYTDLFDIDDVPEVERKKVAREVADWVLASIAKK